MANVSVYNMEGKEVGTIELNDAVFGVEVNEHLVHMAVVAQLANNVREHRKQKHVLRFPVAAESRGDRKEQVTLDRVPQDLRSGQAAEWYSLRLREITQSLLTRKRRELLSSPLLQAE